MEYISREDVIKKIAEKQDKAMYGREDVAFYQAIKIIREEPAADVQPVKYGKWLSRCEGDIYEFSECSECGNMESCETPYCAQCGARMIKDGDAE